jgi:hypothetical protein
MERQPQHARRERRAQIGIGPRASRGWQIGPKIRVGGTLGKIGQNVKIATGKVLSNPIVDAGLTFVPGVGPGLAAAAAAGGRALDTTNGGLHGTQGVMDLGTSALKGYGAGKLGQGVDNYMSSLLSSAKGADGATNWMDVAKNLFSGGGADGQGNLGALGDLAGKLGGGASSVLGGVSSALGGGGGGGGGSDLIDKLLLAGTVASGVADKQRAQGFQDKAASYATGNYDANAPLRDQARSLLQDRSTPDLSNIFANSENPYDRARRGSPALGTRAPVASTY